MTDPTRNLRAAAACLAAAAALAACASSSRGPGETGPDADRRFYEGRCGVCHVPFHRSDFPARKWSSILDVMAPKAGLSPAQRERIQRYLTAPEPVAAGAGGDSR